MFSAAGTRPKTEDIGQNVRYWALRLLGACRGRKVVAKGFPTRSAHKEGKRAASSSSFPSV